MVLFHVTANAEWSSLPLSGLFVQMLERLTQSAGGAGPSPEALAGTTWTPVQVMNGFGELESASMVAGVPGERLADARPSPETPARHLRQRRAPGGGERDARGRRARAARGAARGRAWSRRWSGRRRPASARGCWRWRWRCSPPTCWRRCGSPAGSAARAGRRRPAAGAVLLACLALGAPRAAAAQDPAADADAIYAANQTVLAYVVTGDARVDAVSEAGLRGLSRTLFDRTAIEPADPVAVDLETDDLALYPFLYWPVTESQRAALRRRLRAAERLPALRRHDPLRHPRRRPRRRASAAPPRTGGRCSGSRSSSTSRRSSRCRTTTC